MLLVERHSAVPGHKFHFSSKSDLKCLPVILSPQNHEDCPKITVHLNSDETLAANESCTQMNSEQEASEKVARIIVEV